MFTVAASMTLATWGCFYDLAHWATPLQSVIGSLGHRQVKTIQHSLTGYES